MRSINVSPSDPTTARISKRQANQVAFRKAYSAIQEAYTPGRFVAISDGQIVADADRFEELRAALISLGKDPTQVLIIQAGVEYPESAVIYCRSSPLLAHVGLGKSSGPTFQVETLFPSSGKRVVQNGVKPGQLVVVREE